MAQITINGTQIDFEPGTVGPPAGLGSWHRDPALLLPRFPQRAGELSHLPGRDLAAQPPQRQQARIPREAGAHLLHPGGGRHGGLHQHPPCDRQPEGGDGTPAGQPPCGLPGLRPGRRVPPAGLLLPVRSRPESLPGGQEQGAEEGRGPQRPALLRPLHHVHPVCPVHP